MTSGLAAPNGTFPSTFKGRKPDHEASQPLRGGKKKKSAVDVSVDPSVEYIDLEEDYQLKIYGYQKNRLYEAAAWTFIIASWGVFGLICYWFPRLMLYVTHKRCPLETATKVLVEERYKDHRSSFHVKKIVVLSCDSLLEYNSNNEEACNWDPTDVENIKIEKDPKFSVHISGGIFRKMETARYFNCQKYRFVWDDEERLFRRLTGLDSEVPVSYFHRQAPLSSMEQYFRRAVYGANEIIVPVRSLLVLLFMEVLNPFYVFQFMSFILWYFDDYVLYASTIFIITVAGIVSSCLSTYFNQKALHSRVCSTDEVQIIQGGEQISVPTEQLVPGDILVLPTQGGTMYCDAVLLNGSCIANESSLTGESDPIMKTPIPDADVLYDNKEHSRHTLYCGTEILQTRFYGDKHVLAVVIRTGFFTVKGSVIRSMLYPAPADYKFEKHSYKFLQVLALIAGIGFIYTIVTKISRGVKLSQMVLESLDLITIVVPPALPAAMTIGAVHALLRLKSNRVYCISPRAINVSGSVNCVCFDKTGTLTEEGLDMWGVMPIVNGQFLKPVRDITSLDSGSDLLHSMVTCHTLTIIRNELCGDPMDLKIFNSTGWILEEPAAKDDAKYDLLIPTIVKPPSNTEPVSCLELGKEIGIVRHFTFSSSLQRMTVITRVLGASHYTIYCKGAPENICNLCVPETVPREFNKILKSYTRKGYRVIAAAHRPLPKSVNYTKMQRLSREEVESDLIMLGLIILENKLKPETAPVISALKKANIRTVIATGDNMLTAVSVARDCGIIMPDQDVITVEYVEFPVPRVYYTLADVSPASSNTLSPVDVKHLVDAVSINISEDIEDVDVADDAELHVPNGRTSATCELLSSIPKKYAFAITGSCWSFLKHHFPDLIPYIAIRGTIFSRMNPDQKQHLVQELQDLGYVVAMCGDGANDCGALKAAHAGISLSSNESSGASQFTSQRQDIRCVLDVIRECRAALVISFTIFKFMASYSLTQFISIIILYSIDTNLTDAQFLYIDLFVIASCALSLGHTPPFQGELAKRAPPSSLVSLAPITSLLCQTVVIAVMQLIAFFTVQTYSWFIPYDPTVESEMESSYENYAVFSISALQYVILAVCFHKGPPYVGYICSNYFLVACLVTVTSVSMYLILSPAEWIQERMELKVPPDMSFRLVIVIFGFVNLLLSLFIEFVLCDYVIASWLKFRLKRNPKWSKRYSNIERELKECSNWPVVSFKPDAPSPSYSAQKQLKNTAIPRRRCVTLTENAVSELVSYVPFGSLQKASFKAAGSTMDFNSGLESAESIYASINGIIPEYVPDHFSSQGTIHSEYYTPRNSFSINFYHRDT